MIEILAEINRRIDMNTNSIVLNELYSLKEYIEELLDEPDVVSLTIQDRYDYEI